MENAVHIERLNIRDLSPNLWNTNRLEPAAFRKLKSSMETLGSFKPIVIRTLPDGTNQILGGQHRWQAAMELGWTEIDCANLGDIDDVAAKSISVIDNERYGEDDEIAFSRLLEEIQASAEFDLSDLMDVSFDLDLATSAARLGDIPDELLNSLDDAPELSAEVERVREKATEETQSVQIMRFRVPVELCGEVQEGIQSVIDSQAIHTGDKMLDAGEALAHIVSEWSKK